MSNSSDSHSNRSDDHDDNDELEIISKTALKKASHHLQDLGIALAELKPDELATIPIDDSLQSAITDLQKIRTHSARKRQMQFVGKLMRNADYEAIETAFEKLSADKQNDARRLHIVEQWRDRLIDPNDIHALKEFLDHHPTADRQQLRQLTKNAQTEHQAGKPPASARKLFKLLRDVINQ